MDAIQASIEHIKDGISGAQVMNSDTIVLDLAAAEFLLGLCELNVKLTRVVGVGITQVHQFGGVTLQMEITDYVGDSELDYTPEREPEV
jgi:hypothetical protein